MKIEIWSDFSCPFCYVSKVRLERALSKVPFRDKVKVVFKSYILDPLAPIETKVSSYELFAKAKQMELSEVQELFNDSQKIAKTIGVTFDYDHMKMTSTYDAHRLAKWSNQFGLESAFTERLMKAYFVDGLNISNHTTLIDLAKEVGLDELGAHSVLENNRYEEAVVEDLRLAEAIRIQSVPFFILNNQFTLVGLKTETYYEKVLNHLYNEELTQRKLRSSKTEVCTGEGCNQN